MDSRYEQREKGKIGRDEASGYLHRNQPDAVYRSARRYRKRNARRKRRKREERKEVELT